MEDAVQKVRAIVGLQNIPETDPLAQSALDKLHMNEIPTADELTALEIVVRLLRPVVLSRDCSLEDLPDAPGRNLQPQKLKDLWSGFRTRIGPMVCSIGRVETAKGKHIGTGFLVADGVLATNRHVLGALTLGSEALGANAARVVFKHEFGQRDADEDRVPIEGVAAIHPTLDMVLLKTPKSNRQSVELDPVAATEGAQVVAIGYPAEDTINNPLFLTAVFQGKFGVKRAALGEVLDGTESPVLFHDCSTTQGNSGSPVFSLTSGMVVGIHRAGFFMYRNEAVDAEALRKFIRTVTP